MEKIDSVESDIAGESDVTVMSGLPEMSGSTLDSDIPDQGHMSDLTDIDC